MDVAIEIVFADGRTKTLKIAEDLLVSDIISQIGAECLGIEDETEINFIQEWGLARYHQASTKPGTRWLDVDWLDPCETVSAILNIYGRKLLFGKKILTAKDHELVNSIPSIHNIIYFQLLQTYLSGHYHCTATKAIKLSSLAAYASTNDYLTSGTKWLEEFVPPRLQCIPQISMAVSKNLKRIQNKSEKIVQTAFIKGLTSLDMFGYSFYTAQMDKSKGVIAMKSQEMVWLDYATREPILAWNLSKELSSVTISSDGIIKIVFETESISLRPFNRIISELSRYVEISYEEADAFNSYVLDTASTADKDESSSTDTAAGIVPPPPHQQQSGEQVNTSSSKSPISRNGDRRKAFRQKSRPSPINPNDLDDIKELSILMKTNLTNDLRWNNRDSNPIYDSIAGTRVDATLKRSKVTFMSLSNSNSVTTTTPAPEEMAGRQTPAEYSQRLGMYPIEMSCGIAPGDNENKSKRLLPGEALKDYATLKKEFRMFCVKLPNGVVHWELASLYQPIRKLIARLCVIIHIDDPENYELTVEGTVVNYLKKSNRFGIENNNHVRDFMSSSPGSLSQSLFDVNSDEPFLLNSSLSFSDHEINTSRILSLNSTMNTFNEMTNVPTVKIPEWVKFRQCWLSVVHGNHPCSLQEAITLAAILYQCYVLDRTEVNSVISFCSVLDFLPAQYASINGIEAKVLQERESLLSYSRCELQQFYIEEVCSSPVYNYAFFACKEPKKQFLSNSKMHPVLMGIGREGIVRMNCKTKEVIDTWGYDVLKNWGHAQCSFMLAFDSSTYPVKCSQGKWMAELVSFYVQSIVKSKGILNDNTYQQASNNTPNHHPYFSLETESSTVQSTPSLPSLPHPTQNQQTAASTKYFTLEKVYDDLVEIRRNTVLDPQPTSPFTPRGTAPMVQPLADELYVNPLPNCSLINPNSGTIAQFQKLGITSEDEPLYDEVPFEGDVSSSDLELDFDEEEDETYDDVIYYNVPRRTSSEHVYDIPPDAM